MVDRIGLIIPSVHDKLGNWRKVFIEKVIPSYKYLSKIDNLDFLFNFQAYGDDIDEVIRLVDKITEYNKTWIVKYIIKDRYVPVSMYKIRQDIADMALDDYLYVILDDDVIFKDGVEKCYKEIIQFFNEDDNLGMVMSAGFLGGYNYVGKLRYDDCKWYWTNRGLFVRNTGKKLYPEETTGSFVGGYEDIFLAIELLADGYKLATHFNNPTFHRSDNWKSHELGVDKSKLKERDEQDLVNNPPCEELEKYLQTKYNFNHPIKCTKDFKKLMSQISRQK